jgi:mRNA interferase RelE/StbE
LIYKITYKNSVARDLKKIDKTQRKVILDKIDSELSQRADQFPQLIGKFTGLRKYRIGHYRVIYAILNDTVIVLRIAHRKEAYK